MLMLLDLITERYLMTRLRTSALNGLILTQARAVLDHLFFPLHIKSLVTQVDMMNKTPLYYLEHLDAFKIM